MKRKIVIISAVVIAIIVVPILALTNMLTKGAITGKLYRVDSVYEEIWNLVVSEKNGTQTILTTSIEGSEVVYGLGCFEQVSIPVNDEYRVALCFYQNEFYQDELIIWLFENNTDTHDTPLYVYNYQTNTLYGNREESYLIEKFISLYYSWAGKDGKFKPENPGIYTYVFDEYPLPPHK